ncbi:hypothetical protein AGIG_G3349 [Arapaima gigas]
MSLCTCLDIWFFSPAPRGSRLRVEGSPERGALPADLQWTRWWLFPWAAGRRAAFVCLSNPHLRMLLMGSRPTVAYVGFRGPALSKRRRDAFLLLLLLQPSSSIMV